jgi:hypothetical protein
MGKRGYNQGRAQASGEITRLDMPTPAVEMLDLLSLGGCLRRSVTRKNYWVTPGLAERLSLEEPPEAAVLLNDEARQQHPDRKWVPVGLLLEKIVEVHSELGSPWTIGDVKEAVKGLAPELKPIHSGIWAIDV